MKRACVVGWPIAHSRSPLIHGYWLKRYGIDGSYVRRPLPPEDAAAFFRDLAAEGFTGCNVTVPHKEAAFRASARPDAAARSVGAANTLWLEEGVLCASNTDIYGFISNLDDQAPGWDKIGQPVAVLGAGGAARGVIRGLLDRGVRHVRLANRSRERAEALAAAFGGAISVFDWESRDNMLINCGLLVNTTTLGMAGQPPLNLGLSRLSTSRRSLRYRVHAARNRPASAGPGHGAARRRRPGHAAASGRARLREMVRHSPRGDARAARAYC